MVLTPSWHSSRYIKNHPNAKPITPEKPSPAFSEEVRSPIVLWIFRAAGVATIFGGYGVMALQFWPGVIIVWAGFCLLIYELCVDDGLNRNPQYLQIVMIYAVLLLFDLFTIKIVTPIDQTAVNAYALKNTHPAGTTIAKILWDPHFTDLRVTITNSAHDPLQGLDMWIYPRGDDDWVYDSGIVEGPSNCELKANKLDALMASPKLLESGKYKVTVVKAGDSADFHDDHGNEYKTYATKGVRLTCQSFPPESSIQLVLAVVKPDPRLAQDGGGPNTFRSQVVHNANSPLDLLLERPFPDFVYAEKSYTRNWKPFFERLTTPVRAGD